MCKQVSMNIETKVKEMSIRNMRTWEPTHLHQHSSFGACHQTVPMGLMLT